MAVSQTADGDYLAPGEPTPFVESVISNDEFEWETTRTRRFTIYYEVGSHASHHLGFIRESAEAAVDRALQLLDEAEYERGTRLFMVSTRDRMKTLVGARYKGLAEAHDDALLLVFNEDVRPYFRHEIMHVISINLWGDPIPWIREASAVYADGNCLSYENPMHTISAYMMGEDLLFSLDEIINTFEGCARENDLVAYLQAASFFEYLVDRFGMDNMKRLWLNATEIEATLGVPLEELEKDWRGHLASIDASDVDWEELIDRGCG